MKPKLLSLVAVAAWLFAYTPAHATPGNHFMCYQSKDAKKLCWGTAGAPAECAVTDKIAGFCYGGADNGNLCADPTECDTGYCYTDDCPGGEGPCYVGLPKGIQVTLADAFTGQPTQDYDVKKPTEICAPADKAGEDPGAENDPEHLMAFQIKAIKGGTKATKTNILVGDQFLNNQAVLVIKENRLWVPATKDLGGPAGAFPTNLDHYKCYKAKGLKKVCVGGSNQYGKCKDDSECPGGGFCSQGLAKQTIKTGDEVTVTDQFQADRDYDIIKLKQVCFPVDKNSEGIDDPSLFYTCYLAKPSKTPVPQAKFAGVSNVRINDQFGNQLVNVAKERELCVPAEKDPVVMPPTTTTTSTTVVGTTTTTVSACNGDCDALITPGSSQMAFTTGLATGQCGTLSNFRCSNNVNGSCVDNSDCNFGSCIDPPGICGGDFTVMCSGHGSPCTGTCGEVVALNLPLPLDCGGLYTGGGGNSVPLPFPVPDMGTSVTTVTAYNAGTGVLTLGAATAADTGSSRTCTQGRTCTGGANDGDHCVLNADCNSNVCTTNCNFGPPLPIPNPGTPATSVCTVNDVDFDATGTGVCDTSAGDSSVSAPLRSNVFLTGDLFKLATPPDLPGVQPCPLCDTLCVGGSNDGAPCTANGDCDSNNCNTGQTTCLGGPNDGLNCEPGTSDSATLGDTEGAYPTSHDCPPEPSTVITQNIGGLPINFTLTTGSVNVPGTDLSATTGAQRVFAGFCRDNLNGGSGCFEGNTSGSCPAAIPAAAGNGVACSSDADCQSDTDSYESCAQRTSGAFSEAAATLIELSGATDNGCIGDGLPHTQDLVSEFAIPPTFDAVVDAAGDLPGPGAAMIRGDAQLLP